MFSYNIIMYCNVRRKDNGYQYHNNISITICVGNYIAADNGKIHINYYNITKLLNYYFNYNLIICSLGDVLNILS